ncbi:hypothetical protein VTN77DRAFT_3967 [Rasamsonia byssochlamydoides]|uniref:uncharacterized protein n=1 Tax=Rasamsonia byssochlamydoides TaxID=89139 RepID=UPI0037430D5B
MPILSFLPNVSANKPHREQAANVDDAQIGKAREAGDGGRRAETEAMFWQDLIGQERRASIAQFLRGTPQVSAPHTTYIKQQPCTLPVDKERPKGSNAIRLASMCQCDLKHPVVHTQCRNA